MGIFINIGKFLLGAVIKSVVIVLITAVLWLLLCILLENGFKAGLISFVESKATHFILGWMVGAVMLILEGTVQSVATGILMIFAPIILLSISTPNPDIDLYDSSGNLWKLRKG